MDSFEFGPVRCYNEVSCMNGGIKLFTGLFWKDTAERAVKTFAQALLALLIVAPQTPVIGFDWPTLLFTAATSAVISVLTSIVSVVATSGDESVSPASIATDDRGV